VVFAGKVSVLTCVLLTYHTIFDNDTLSVIPIEYSVEIFCIAVSGLICVELSVERLEFNIIIELFTAGLLLYAFAGTNGYR
jgi:hypothetical protein